MQMRSLHLYSYSTWISNVCNLVIKLLPHYSIFSLPRLFPSSFATIPLQWSCHCAIFHHCHAIQHNPLFLPLSDNVTMCCYDSVTCKHHNFNSIRFCRNILEDWYITDKSHASNTATTANLPQCHETCYSQNCSHSKVKKLTEHNWFTLNALTV